jgi:hypothetical protein
MHMDTDRTSDRSGVRYVPVCVELRPCSPARHNVNNKQRFGAYTFSTPMTNSVCVRPVGGWRGPAERRPKRAKEDGEISEGGAYAATSAPADAFVIQRSIQGR